MLKSFVRHGFTTRVKKEVFFLLLQQCRSESSGAVRNAAVQVKINSTSLRRHEKVLDLIRNIRKHSELRRPCSHVEHLMGRVVGNDEDTDIPNMDVAEETHQVMQSSHPVRHILEREIANHTKNGLSYYDWLMLFGKGIRVSTNPKYDQLVKLVSKSADAGMFSSDIHQTVLDIPENYTPQDIHAQFTVANKYAVLVGDYFAIRCINFIEMTKNSKALMAITKGLEDYTTANFAVQLLDKSIKYPVIPQRSATLEDWILHSKKSAGYFSGGLYAIVVINYGSLPQNELLRTITSFVSNLSVLIQGMSEIEAFENNLQLLTMHPYALTSLSSVLYQRKNPSIYNRFRDKQFQIVDCSIKEVLEEIERSGALAEAKFILGEIAAETKSCVDGIFKDSYYAMAIQDLIDTVVSFE